MNLKKHQHWNKRGLVDVIACELGQAVGGQAFQPWLVMLKLKKDLAWAMESSSAFPDAAPHFIERKNNVSRITSWLATKGYKRRPFVDPRTVVGSSRPLDPDFLALQASENCLCSMRFWPPLHCSRPFRALMDPVMLREPRSRRFQFGSRVFAPHNSGTLFTSGARGSLPLAIHSGSEPNQVPLAQPRPGFAASLDQPVG